MARLLAVPCPSHLCSQCVSPRAVTSDICCQCRLCPSSRCTAATAYCPSRLVFITIAPESLPALRKLPTLLFAQQVDSFRINVARALLDLLDDLAAHTSPFLDPVLRTKPLDFDMSTHPSLPSMTTCLSPCWRKPSSTPPSTSVCAPTLVAIRHPVSFRDLFWDLGLASVIGAVSPSVST
jgi:hypothetical protein